MSISFTSYIVQIIYNALVSLFTYVYINKHNLFPYHNYVKEEISSKLHIKQRGFMILSPVWAQPNG